MIPHLKLSKLLQVLCAFSFITLLVSSAHAKSPKRKGHYTLKGATVSPLDQNKIDGKVNNFKSKTLKALVRFDITAIAEKIEGSDAKKFLITNEIDKSKSSLTLDKPIWHNKIELKPGTNLLGLETPITQLSGKVVMIPSIDIGTLRPQISKMITFDNSFKFPTGTYTFTFHWETLKGEKLSTLVEVLIDLTPPVKK